MNPKMQEWSPIVAAILTVAGGMIVVWWQMHGMAIENRQVLEQLNTTIQSSNKFRQMVRWPLEGRWDYTLIWDNYYETPTDEKDKSKQFFSKGLADIQLLGDQYQVLLGYENSVRDGRRLVVSVNTGFCKATEDGIPTVGSRIDMGYSHRLGMSDVKIGDSFIDFSSKPEERYHYIIDGYERTDEGEIIEIRASFTTDQSNGTVLFTRLF